MRRLIDAGKILDELSGMLKIMDDYDAVRKVINDMPTAYDVDAVVEQIRDMQAEMEQFGLGDMPSDIIEIVRGGGVNEIN